MYPEKPQHHGKRGFLSFLEDILLKIFGIWTKQGIFGVLYQRMVKKSGLRGKAKQRFMIALIANAAGEKESAIVIWKAEKPRCLKDIDICKLPVTYFSQTNA